MSIAVNEHLLKLADQLDKAGNMACADAVDSLIQSGSLAKVAQYVGAIGYVLKQHRAMSNCIRKKRVASDTSMQEVVLGCLKEYQDGQDYENTEWSSKYAQVISEVPEQFDNAHLTFLYEIAQDSNLEGDISSVIKTAKLLHENGIKNEVVQTVASHYKDLNDILRKEADSSRRPFKLAALPQKKKWWQQVFSPSKKRWWAPQSWTERGEDQDTQSDMDTLLQNIMEITDSSRRVKSNIQTLQNDILPPLANSRGSEAIVQQISQLNPSDWSQTIKTIQSLDQLMGSVDLLGVDTFRSANDYITALKNDMVAINQDTRDIQQIMSELRQRPTIRGRYNAFTEEGEVDPRAAFGPSSEWGMLSQILDKLYQNPFDEQSQFYSQQAHSRLDDKLRSIPQENDPRLQGFLESKEETAKKGIPPKGDHAAIDQTAPIDPQKIDDALSYMQNVSPENIQRMVHALNVAFEGSMPKEVSDFLYQLSLNAGKVSQPAAELPHNEGSSERIAPEEDINPEDPDPADEHREAIESATARLNNLIPKPPNSTAFVLESFIKFADALDHVNPEVVDIIDKYIEENSNELAELPDFPEFGALVREEGKSAELSNK